MLISFFPNLWENVIVTTNRWMSRILQLFSVLPYQIILVLGQGRCMCFYGNWCPQGYYYEHWTDCDDSIPCCAYDQSSWDSDW